MELIRDVLAACTPALLAEIEDSTAAGSGRILLPWTWPLWHGTRHSAVRIRAAGRVGGGGGTIFSLLLPVLLSIKTSLA